MPFIYSTLSGDQNYNVYDTSTESTRDTPRKTAGVFIKGGANVMPKPGTGFGTPAGAETEVSADELDLLNANPVFRTHVDNGFITIVNSKKSIEKGTADLEKKDGSAPLTDKSFDGTELKPTVGKPSKG